MKHPFAHLHQRADVKACCRDMGNLVVRPEGPDVLKARCRVCGRGHTKMLARGFDFANLLRGIGPMERTEQGLLVPKER